MKLFPQGVVLAVVVALFAGCGSSKPVRSAAAVTDCLNGARFLVSNHGNQVAGSTQTGLAFTLTVRTGRPSSISTAGDPKGARLSRGARRVVAACLRKHGPQPGTLTAPAAR